MIHLTPEAVARVKKHLAKRGTGIGVHVDVVRSGCSGYSYHIDFIDSVGADQLAFAQDGFQVVVDKDDAALLDGLELAVKKQGLNEFFAFNNPQATATCGCGTSFSVSK